MGQRGPKSNAELSVVRSGCVTAIERPDPPQSLTSEQAAVWVRIINALPADWIEPGAYTTLEQHCRHVVSARKVSRLINQFESGEIEMDIQDYNRLLNMRTRETALIHSGGTKLRLLPQNTRSAGKTKGKSPAIPHEFDG